MLRLFLKLKLVQNALEIEMKFIYNINILIDKIHFTFQMYLSESRENGGRQCRIHERKAENDFKEKGIILY